MKTVKAFVLIGSIAARSVCDATEPVWEWVQLAGGMSEDAGTGVAVDLAGNVYFSGFSFPGKVGTNSVSSGSHFWTKLNGSGAFSSVRLAASESDASVNGTALSISADGGLLASGQYYGSIGLGSLPTGNYYAFIAKFNNQLNPVWTKGTIVAEGYPTSAPTVARDGSISFAKSFRSASIDGTEISATGGNNSDMLLVRLNSGGSLNWLRRGGGTEWDGGGPSAFDSAGNVYVGGTFNSSIFAFGALNATRSGSVGGILLKVNSQGVAEWAKIFPLGNLGVMLALKVDGQDNVVIGGSSMTEPFGYPRTYAVPTIGSQAVFAKYDSNGGQIWSKPISNLLIRDLVFDVSGSIIVAGTFSGTLTLGGKTFTSRGGSDIFVGRFDPAGNFIWGKTAGGAFIDTVGQVAIGPDQSIYVAGTLRDGGTFESFVDGRGVGDAFIAKLSSGGSTQLPQITTQPVASGAYFGAQATLSVTATSSAPLTFQWFRNGAAISGATSATFTIPSVRPSDDANYYVEVSNQYGTVRSESARLIVRGDAPVAVTTLAGTNVVGFVDSTNSAAVRFYAPDSPAIQNDGVIVIPDTGNHAIRLLEPNGMVGTLTGIGTPGLTNGPASLAYFNVPIAAAVNSAWDIFIADGFNNVVRKISASGTRAVSTFAGTGEKGFADGAGAQAKFSFPNDLVCDPDGNVFVTEFEGNRVRKITPDGVVSTYAGTGQAGYRDGAAAQALFNQPAGIARDGFGNLYVTEWNNHTIRKITPAGVVSTIAGTAGQSGFVDGPALTTARLYVPNGIAVDNKGNIFFTDWANHAVRRVDPLGDVLTLVGTAGVGFKDGGRTEAQMNHPAGIAVHPDGSLIVAETDNHAIRRVVWQTNATPTEAVVLIEVNPSVTIFGVAGKTYRIESTENLVAPDWTVLGEVTLVSPVETWFDSQPVTRARRFYRAVLKN